VLHLLDAVTRGYCKCYLPCMSCSYCFSCTADCGAYTNVILTRYCSNVDYSHPVMDEIRIYRDVNVITEPINLYISLCLGTLADKKVVRQRQWIDRADAVRSLCNGDTVEVNWATVCRSPSHASFHSIYAPSHVIEKFGTMRNCVGVIG